MSETPGIPPLPTGERISYGIGTIVTFVAMVLGIMANVVFLSVLMVCTGRQSRLRLFLAHLAAADLFVCCFTIALELGWRLTVSWDAGDSMCRVLSMTKTLGLYAESYIVVAMAADHYYTVLWPLNTRSQSHRGKLLLAMAWTSAALFSVPQAVVFHEEEDAVSGFRQCVTLHSFISVNAEKAYLTFGLLAMYGLPLSAIILINSTLVYRVRHMSSKTTVQFKQIAKENMRLNQTRASGSSQGSDLSTYAIGEECTAESEPPSTDLPSQVRVRFHTGLQMLHTEVIVKVQARRRALILSGLMVGVFIISCAPYALAVYTITTNHSNNHLAEVSPGGGGAGGEPDEIAIVVGMHLREGILILTLCLSTLLNPLFYGLYVCYDNWQWRLIEARLPENWELQLPVMEAKSKRANRRRSSQRTRSTTKDTNAHNEEENGGVLE
ncbi:putative Gonadotropin-releasing hormone receptor [Hypsibius exemplaris]|uniref:Gonadotropin-releasing hormone receptor n=1 Tax=Hypsibius exemplaris TaxID=2072580 RepID=A0A9X6NEJ5_HYPEX|nr:putative Gonadotropin-releasing hormone receptor [Hypsibius exemplaris]